MTTTPLLPIELQTRLNRIAVKSALTARYDEPTLTKRQVQAALLLADGNFSAPQIVAVVGCQLSDLKSWRQLPRFVALAKRDPE